MLFVDKKKPQFQNQLWGRFDGFHAAQSNFLFAHQLYVQRSLLV
ncbi:hypothetical protein VFA_000989 [Vibrio furnissii CIP 102972]|nr:hypothetical protein VFA_000989 [Vibrio furnissii CIP 102972]